MPRYYPSGEGLEWAINKTWFEHTGEFRPPRAGEWYISGAVPVAYHVKHDLATAYHIARPIQGPRRQITINGFIYRLEGPERS